VIQFVRHEFFSVSYDERHIEVDMTIDELEDYLGDRHFAPWQKLAYNYRGEDLGMRLTFRKSGTESTYEWYQLHVRAFEDDGTVKLAVHTELDPLQYPSEHLNDINLSVSEAVDMIVEMFEADGVAHTVLSQ
jgi:hypothetical protein